MTHSARSRLKTKGVNAPTNDTPTFTVEILEPRVRRPGPIWVRVRKAEREWVAPVFSQSGAPFIPTGVGGDGLDSEPPPRSALLAVYEALKDLWDSDPGMLMFAGFANGVRSPHKPGGHREPPEMLAVRVRRMLRERQSRPTRRGRTTQDALASVEIALHTRRAWSNTEKDVLKRARGEGVYSDGALTARGEALLSQIDQAKAAALETLTSDGLMTADALAEGLAMFSEPCVEAALFDLEAEQAVTRERSYCDTCGQPQVKIG